MQNITILNNKYKLQNETIFANAKEIAETFGIAINTVSEHIKNIFITGELLETETCRIFRNVSNQPVNYYSLDMIIAVGYRVSSPKGTKFRIEATKVLKEYLSKGKDFSRKELALMIIESEDARELAEQKAKMFEIENIQKEEIIHEQEEIIEKKTQIIENHIKQESDISMTDFARKHNLHPNKFTEKLRGLGYLYRKDNVNVPYVEELKKHFVAKYTKDINGKTRNNYYLTSKGCDHFISRLEKGDFDDIRTSNIF